MSRKKPRRNPSNRTGQLELVGAGRKPSRVLKADTHALDDDGFFHRPLHHRAYNTLIGISLLPFAWILTLGLFSSLSQVRLSSTTTSLWLTHEFITFALGAAGWTVWFCFSILIWGEPRPLRVYVWGHEMMHAVWAKVFGGRIKEFEGWNRNGGYIVTDKYNFWIALAPYLYPFYSIPVLAAWGLGGLYFDVWSYREWFFGLLGLTWMFHLTFTLWMIPKGQSDFLGPGRIFSFVWIYLANLTLVGCFLIMLDPEVTWNDFFRHCARHAWDFYQTSARLITWVLGGK